MDAISRKQMMRAHYEFLIAAMKEACNKSLQILEKMRDNPDCFCEPDNPDIMCAACMKLMYTVVKDGDRITNFVEIEGTGNSSGAPDKSAEYTHAYRENCLCDGCTVLRKATEPDDPDWPDLIG